MSVEVAVDERRRGLDDGEERAVGTRVRERAWGGKLELPMLPEVVQQVLAAAADERCDARKLAELVRKDPTVAAHVLRVANSSLYAAREPIVSVQQALTRLGIGGLRQILLVIACQTKAFRVRGREVEIRRELDLAVVCAAFAQEIARTRRLNVETAFLAGLLHDVGRPIVLQAIVDLQAELGKRLSAEAEQRLVDDLHAQAGAALVTEWQLPPALAEVVLHHHAPFAAPGDRTHIALVALADDIAAFALGSREAPPLEVFALHPTLPLIGLYPDDVAALLEKKDEIVTRARSCS
jgi:putative nucleotidyltransferase with HDIG domain